MTRLVKDDISDIVKNLDAYDVQLNALCGQPLADIARLAAGRGECDDDGKVRIAIVPVTSGQGIIGGFCQTLAGIVEHLGYPAYVTKASDLAGFAQGVVDKADIIISADDDTFVAVNPKKQLVSNNNGATARGFATALQLAAHGLTGKPVLLLGAGIVGSLAASALQDYGAEVTVYDIDPGQSAALLRANPSIHVAENFEEALREHSLLYDATSSGGFIKKDMLHSGTILAAPGVPFCLDRDSALFLKGKIIHDVLELGTATMLFDVL